MKKIILLLTLNILNGVMQATIPAQQGHKMPAGDIIVKTIMSINPHGLDTATIMLKKLKNLDTTKFALNELEKQHIRDAIANRKQALSKANEQDRLIRPEQQTSKLNTSSTASIWLKNIINKSFLLSVIVYYTAHYIIKPYNFIPLKKIAGIAFLCEILRTTKKTRDSTKAHNNFSSWLSKLPQRRTIIIEELDCITAQLVNNSQQIA
ncbi:MAG: hypothetical protein WC707_00045 [Candidatus Babeliaceae bacterium]|jgi:hypothetical protein